MSTDARPRLAADVLSFYLEHPQTTESAEGLARWRLLERCVEKTMNETEQAVAWLVEKGYLCTVPGLGSRRLFALNIDRLRDAEVLVADGPKDADGGA
jgi:hypothetical protein